MYFTETSVLVDSTVEHVRPVLRPLLATAVTLGVSEDTGRTVLAGASSAGIPPGAVSPSSRMVPAVSTAPETTLAIAASAEGLVA